MSYDVIQSVARKLDVVLTAQSDGITPVTNAAATDLVARYRKEGAVSSTLKTVASGDWQNLDQGVYRLAFTAAELDTLGSLTYAVTIAVGATCTQFVPYYGHVDVVVGDVSTVVNNLTTVGGNVLGVSGAVVGVGSQVTTVGNNVLGVSGEVASLQISVASLNNFIIGAGAYYDSDAGSLTASLVLHKNGEVVTNPTSATIIGFDEDGNQIFTDTSIAPDAQGVFKFVVSVTLVTKTVPYLRGTIVNADGTHHTVTLTPVVS